MLHKKTSLFVLNLHTSFCFSQENAAQMTRLPQQFALPKVKNVI